MWAGCRSELLTFDACQCIMNVRPRIPHACGCVHFFVCFCTTCANTLPCECDWLWAAYTWTLLAAKAQQLTASRKRGREVSPGIKGQGRLWIICYGWGATFIAISSPYREWLFDSTPQQYSQTQPSPLILPAATSPWLLSLNICDNQPYFSIPPCHLQCM